MNKKILSVVLILCVMLAVMPMTAYAADIAFCSKCNRIQTVRLTYQYSNDEWHICNVTCTVCNNIWFYGMSHKWSGTATCTSGRTCTECGGSSEPLGHDWGTWTQNSDEKTHTRICKRDTSHTETENCHGGTATCTEKAICEDCNAAYGEMAAHSFTAEKAEAQYLKSAATCTEKAIYYKSCAVCGLSSEGTADEATFFSGNALDHNWGAWTSNEDGTHTRTCTVDGCSAGTQTENCIDANKDHKCDICDYIISECADDNKDHKCDYCGKKLTEHTGGKATCKDKAKCEVCGAEYGELDAKNHTNLKHFPATAATKTTEGNIEYWYCEGCGKYYSDKDGTKEIKKADTVTAKLKDDSKSPQTGDTSNLALWIALLFVSGGADIGTTDTAAKTKPLISKENAQNRPETIQRETDAPIFTEGGDDCGGYENWLCRENRRHDFRCQRNARRERRAHAGGACKGSDCKRSNGFAGSGDCLIDFTHSHALWRFFKKYLKTT